MSSWSKTKIKNPLPTITGKRFQKTFLFHRSLVYYGRDGEMAQKVIDGENVTWQHMHLKLRWLKIRTMHFSLISSSKYWSRVFWSKWLTFFSSKILRWLKIRIIIASNSISLRILSHNAGTWHCRLRWLFEPSHHPSRTSNHKYATFPTSNWLLQLNEAFWLRSSESEFRIKNCIT